MFATLGRSAFACAGTWLIMKTAVSDAAKVTRSIAYAVPAPNDVVISPATTGLITAPRLQRIELSAITAAIISTGITFWINDSNAGRWIAANPA